MTFDEEKLGWAFAGAEGLEKRIAACEKLAETDVGPLPGGTVKPARPVAAHD
jgi:hypothetical protein